MRFDLAQIFDNPATTLSLFVFLGSTTLAFALMLALRARGAVKRRAAGVAASAGALSDDRSLRHASIQTAQRVVDYASRHFSIDETNARELRRRLVQAGFLDSRAIAFFLLARVVLAVGLAILTFMAVPLLLPAMSDWVWQLVLISGLCGYFVPNVYLNKRISRRKEEHRSGFPDFMDLLVVCAEAGLSMEAALDRVGRELADSYPSLSANVYMATLEIRAGRTLSESLEHLGDRLGLEEARSFATLLQQSEELGSSLTDALRVYSDDMRHKRLSLAEEKAYSLPAKMSVPLIMFIFPVIIIVIMLPVIVRVKMGAF